AHICRELAAAGAAFDLGAPDEIAEALPPVIAALAGEPERLAGMSAAAAAICDGRGTARVAEALLAGRGE
ncbi:hypothetical protein RZS08_00255, partial [Arthrospira platensis SPKY1]|nr:hypothetical protein [Arthrospira platensis SPKY1]